MFTAFGFRNRTKRRIFSKAMGRVPKKSCQQIAAERRVQGPSACHQCPLEPLGPAEEAGILRPFISWWVWNWWRAAPWDCASSHSFCGPAGDWMLATRRWKIRTQLWQLCPLPGGFGPYSNFIFGNSHRSERSFAHQDCHLSLQYK